jgi:hypothetical protein
METTKQLQLSMGMGAELATGLQRPHASSGWPLLCLPGAPPVLSWFTHTHCADTEIQPSPKACRYQQLRMYAWWFACALQTRVLGPQRVFTAHPIHPWATAVNGIKTEDLIGEPPFRQCARRLHR